MVARVSTDMDKTGQEILYHSFALYINVTLLPTCVYGMFICVPTLACVCMYNWVKMRGNEIL